MVRSHLPLLTSRYQIDLVVANGENAAHGKGITRRIYHQLIGYGIDVMTMGNHTFAKSDLYNFIDEADRMVRPMNMAPTEYGRSVLVREVKGKRVAVVNLCGEIFMHICMRRQPAKRLPLPMRLPAASARSSARIRMCRRQMSAS